MIFKIKLSTCIILFRSSIILTLTWSKCLVIAWLQSHSASWTRLSDFTFTFHFHALEKEMATHPSVLAWRTPGTGEPGGLPSMESYIVGHKWSDLAAEAAAAAVPFCSDLGDQEKKICYSFHFFFFCLPWSDGIGYHDLRFMNVEF